MVTRRNRIFLAVLSLIIGSLAAPVVYVALGLLAPMGFADLRGASAITLALYFGAAWAVSAIATLAVGAAGWQILHRRGWDGVVTYALAGASVAVLIGLLLGHQNWEAILMAIANAVVVRMVELRLRGAHQQL